jgi:hypothetical protein
LFRERRAGLPERLLWLGERPVLCPDRSLLFAERPALFPGRRVLCPDRRVACPERRVARPERFLVDAPLRRVSGSSADSCSPMEPRICSEAPWSVDSGCSPSLAARATPAAICCCFDFAGMADPPSEL